MLASNIIPGGKHEREERRLRNAGRREDVLIKVEGQAVDLVVFEGKTLNDNVDGVELDGAVLARSGARRVQGLDIDVSAPDRDSYGGLTIQRDGPLPCELCA